MERDAETIRALLEMLFQRTGRRYSEKLIRLGTDASNNRRIDRPDGHAALKGECGDTVEFFLRVAGGKIEDAAFTIDGCLSAYASLAAVAEMARGRTLRGCLGVNQSAIEEYLGGMPEEDRHCALLAARALQKALRDYAVGKTRKG
jgi:nitrogen fixation NifU-like protein